MKRVHGTIEKGQEELATCSACITQGGMRSECQQKCVNKISISALLKGLGILCPMKGCRCSKYIGFWVLVKKYI